jgi:flagellar motor switch protein FliN
MHSFLDSWIEQAPRTFARAYSGPITLLPSAEEGEISGWVSFAARIEGSIEGRFVVALDKDSYEEGTPEGGEPLALEWQQMVEETAAAALERLPQNARKDSRVSLVEGLQSCELSSARSYALTIGGQSFRLRFLDEVHATGDPVQQVAPPAATVERGDDPAPILSHNLELLLDVELEASLRFGSRSMQLNEVLELGPGDVVQLERHIADPVDLIVGDKIVARGEVVLLNGNFGLRVTEVAEPRRRLETIRCLF